MSKIKKILAIVVTFCLAFGLNTTVFAAAIDNESVLKPDDGGLIKIYKQVFSGNGEVYDVNGNDVTSSFIEKYSEAYQANDYETILSGCYQDNIALLNGHNNVKSNIGARSILRMRYEESVAHLVTHKGFPYDNKSWYIIVTASGTYGY